MEKNKDSAQFNFWKNTSECIACIYNTALLDHWSVFTDKVATCTHSDKVLLSLANQKSTELLLHSCKNNNKKSLDIDFKYKSNQQDIIALNQCTQLFSANSISTKVIPSHCYFCQNDFQVDNTVYKMLFAVSKCDQKHSYNDQEVKTLLCLLPHLINSLTASASHKENLSRLQTLQQAIEQGSKGIILCDDQAKIIFINQFMLNRLINNDFMKVVNDDLVLVKQYENQRFHQLLHCVLKQKLIGSDSITLDNEMGSHALISISPLAKKIIVNAQIATIMITINFEQLMNWSLISHEYQLTNKELILLKALHHNKKLNDLTQVLGVTVNTLRTHLQSIFHKTQTNSQTELMIRLGMFKL